AEITLTQSSIAQMLGLSNSGVFLTYSSKAGGKSDYVKRIAEHCYVDEKSVTSNKVAEMREEQRLLVKIMFSSIFPRRGGTDQISWDHKHFIYFLTVGRRINLAAYIF
ncbi:hypothetical protein A2U01_0067132, partial [Trifolium medium]|nr:hypothetical protein [Trifolium medium]